MTNLKQDWRGKAFQVLLADDDRNDIFLILRSLRSVGLDHAPLVIGDGARVIEYLAGTAEYCDRQQHPFPDLPLLDLFMPGVSGLDVLLWMRRSTEFDILPVVLLTADLSPIQMQMIYTLRCAWCPKTVHFEKLSAAIQEAVLLVSPAGPQAEHSALRRPLAVTGSGRPSL